MIGIRCSEAGRCMQGPSWRASPASVACTACAQPPLLAAMLRWRTDGCTTLSRLGHRYRLFCWASYMGAEQSMQIMCMMQRWLCCCMRSESSLARRWLRKKCPSSEYWPPYSFARPGRLGGCLLARIWPLHRCCSVWYGPARAAAGQARQEAHDSKQAE